MLKFVLKLNHYGYFNKTFIERSFSTGWSDTSSHFFRIRDSSWADSSLSHLLASGLTSRPTSHINAGTGAIWSLPALPWSSFRAKDILGPQKRHKLRKKIGITIFKVVNLLLHFQRYAICSLSVLKLQDISKEILWKLSMLNRKIWDEIPWQFPRKENLFFTYIEYSWAWIQGVCAVYAFYVREGQTNKCKTNQKNPKHHY